MNTLLSPEHGEGRRSTGACQSPGEEHGDAADPLPGLSFPFGGAPAPPPGAGSGCGDPPRPPRLPPPATSARPNRKRAPAAGGGGCGGGAEVGCTSPRPTPHSPWDCGRRRPPPRPPALSAPGGPGPASSGGAPPAQASPRAAGTRCPSPSCGLPGTPGVRSSLIVSGAALLRAHLERWRWRDDSHLPRGRGANGAGDT